MTDFKDPNNIPSLFREMEEHELPKGYDERFEKKLQNEQVSWFKRISLFTLPNLGWATGIASLCAVSLKLVQSRKENIANEMEVDDEIDMLQNLDTLDEWDEDDK